MPVNVIVYVFCSLVAMILLITGSEGRTSAIYLDTPLHDDFEAGQLDKFSLEIPIIGDILAVKVESNNQH